MRAYEVVVVQSFTLETQEASCVGTTPSRSLAIAYFRRWRLALHKAQALLLEHNIVAQKKCKLD